MSVYRVSGKEGAGCRSSIAIEQYGRTYAVSIDELVNQSTCPLKISCARHGISARHIVLKALSRVSWSYAVEMEMPIIDSHFQTLDMSKSCRRKNRISARQTVSKPRSRIA